MKGELQTIPPQSGRAFLAKRGDFLKVIDPEGQQVGDLVFYNAKDPKEKISSGKTLDFEAGMLLTKGSTLWSNRSRPFMKITEDTCGRHDFLLAPCSQETFDILYEESLPNSPSCHKNLRLNLEPFGIDSDSIPTAFNIFMNVQFNLAGQISVQPPLSQAGDYITFEILEDAVIGLTACSAGQSNNGSFKPIQYILS